MRKIIFILLFVSSALHGQLDTIDMGIDDFDIPSRTGEADFVRNIAWRLNKGLRSTDSLNNIIDVTDSTAVFNEVRVLDTLLIGTGTPNAIFDIRGGGVATTAEIHNSLSTGIAAWQIINNAGYRASLGVAGSANAFVTPNSFALYQQGYGPTYFIIDGNEDFVWSTDVADGHALAYTEKMRLKADGALVTDSISTAAIYYNDTYWDDLKAPFTQVRRGALLKPDFDYDNIGLLFPQNDTAEIIYAIMQFSHSRKAGTDISPHIHWQQMNSNNVVWMMQYKWYDNGEAPPAAWTQLTESSDIFTYTSGTLAQLTEFPTIDGSGITGVSSILLIKVWRDDNVDGGAGGGDVLGQEFDVHFEKDQPASANEYSK